MNSAELTEFQALDELRHEERLRAGLKRESAGDAAAAIRKRKGQRIPK